MAATTTTTFPQDRKLKQKKKRRKATKITRSLPIPAEERLLSREEEQKLCEQITRARSIREKLTELIVRNQQQQQQQEPTATLPQTYDDPDNDEFCSDEEFYAKYYYDSTVSDSTIPPFKYHLLEQHHQESILERAEANGGWESSKYDDVPNQCNENEQAVFQDLALVTDHEMVQHFGMERKQISDILHQGALARDTLIQSNLRLVSSIARRFAKAAHKEHHHSYSIYQDAWTRPGLHEAFQDGVLGLITAVERFEPKRGLKFSTFATYWITNTIRRSFQYASSGALRLPINVYDKKAQFNTLIKSYYDKGEDIPNLATIADQLNLSERRLSTILRVTQPLKSLDDVITTSNPLETFESLTFAEELKDESEDPVEQVDVSLLRLSLESVMAGVLAPHERDVLRLRLGLDDGIHRSVKEVASLYDGRLKPYQLRKTEQMALEKLRTPSVLETYHLDDYFESDKHR